MSARFLLFTDLIKGSDNVNIYIRMQVCTRTPEQNSLLHNYRRKGYMVRHLESNERNGKVCR